MSRKKDVAKDEDKVFSTVEEVTQEFFPEQSKRKKQTDSGLFDAMGQEIVDKLSRQFQEALEADNGS